MLLDIQNVSAGYGKLSVLDKVSLQVNAGEIVSLIGHNGGGKTTTLRTIAGILQPTEGVILLDGTDITGKPASFNAEAGIALVPQGRGVFRTLSVYDNLRLGGYVKSGITESEIQSRMEIVVDLFPILGERMNQIAGTMSGGQQQMVAVGMALMSQPRLLLLDEPSTGLAPILVEKMLETVQRINKELNTAVLIVEQNVRQVLEISDRAYVLKVGQIIHESTGQELLARDDLWDLF